MTRPILLSEEESKFWMAKLLTRAKDLDSKCEIPVFAVVLDENGHCIGYGRNQRESKKDPLGHAELIALKQASLIKGDWRFNNCTLIVTLEPCPMCAGALIQARMGQVIYGAQDKKRGALGGTIDLSKHKSSHHNMIVKRGILDAESEFILKEWFKQRRK